MEGTIVRVKLPRKRKKAYMYEGRESISKKDKKHRAHLLKISFESRRRTYHSFRHYANVATDLGRKFWKTWTMDIACAPTGEQFPVQTPTSFW